MLSPVLLEGGVTTAAVAFASEDVVELLLLPRSGRFRDLFVVEEEEVVDGGTGVRMLFAVTASGGGAITLFN